MRVIRGKWQDQNGESINDFNVKELIEIGKKVKSLYGTDITSDRIQVVSKLNSLSEEEETCLSYLLSNDMSISKSVGM
jgi:hypothetical protein